MRVALEVWQPLTSRQLSNEDAREIACNVTGFFGIIQEWARKEKANENNQQTSN